MMQAPEFDSLEEMENSDWLRDRQRMMSENRWPPECRRCEETEPCSIRTYANELHARTHQKDYLQVGGVLDNLCNAACLTCNENLSTRIGSQKGRTFPIVNNSIKFRDLPQDRILHLDINGGEPSYSKNYKALLANLPPNLRTLRVNTNCSTVLTDLSEVASRGIEVTVTVSCDGIGPVHEFVRWPLTWSDFLANLMIYKTMPVRLNLWTTVSVLNVDDLENIKAFAQEHGIDHAWAYLHEPYELSVDNQDLSARQRYIDQQKRLRKMK